MANVYYNTLSDLFTAIANAIRAKKNSTEPIVADTFPTEIENLRSGFDYNNQSVTSIPDYAFYGCEDLNNVDCNNLTSIGTSAFENCTNLKSVVLYDGVTNVGENAFKGCNNVIIYYKGTSIPDTWNDNWNPDNRPVLYGEPVETWDISATSKDNVTAELYNDIDNEGMYSLVISGNGDMADYSSSESRPWYNYKNNITSITILDSVTSIGDRAFDSCYSLTSITIPDSVTSIGTNAFYSYGLKTAGPIGGGYDIEFGWVDNIPNNAFDSCRGLTSITIPDSVTSIGDGAFSTCANLTSITIPDSVTSIGADAFNNCYSLTSITIPDSVTSIGSSAFGNCYSLTSIVIPDSVTSIGKGAFYNCTALTSITIPDSVTSINWRAFYGCSTLESVTIGNSVTSIGEDAFYKCSSLTSIAYTGTTTQWQAVTLDASWDGDTPDYTIHCTDGDIAKDGTITYHTAQ